MKLFLKSPSEDWVVDNLINSFKKYTSLEITDNIDEADIIWHYAGWIWNQFPINEKRIKKKVIITIHHRTPEKKNQWYNDLMGQDVITDYFHVPCKITRDYLATMVNKPIFLMPYWIDKNLFCKIDDPKKIAELKQKLQLVNDYLTIGSFQRDSEGSNLSKPKLEKGPDIFCSIIKKLAKNVQIKGINVLLGGYRRNFVFNQLRGTPKVNIIYPGKVKFNDVNILYNLCDIYLTTSRFEGGPQCLLEASLSKTRILTTKVGSYEAIDPFCHCENEEEFIEKIVHYDDNVIESNFDRVMKNNECQVLVPKYDELFMKIYNGGEKIYESAC